MWHDGDGRRKEEISPRELRKRKMTIPQWLLEKKEAFLKRENSIKAEILDLGFCRMDIYKAPNDLYDSWEIVPASIGKIPNAHYGPDPRNNDDKDSRSQIRRLFKMYTLEDNGHGHYKKTTEIYENGNLLAFSSEWVVDRLVEVV